MGQGQSSSLCKTGQCFSNLTSDEKANSISQSIEKYLLKIQQTEDPIVKKLIETLKKIGKYEIPNFSYYKQFHIDQKVFKDLITEYRTEIGGERDETSKVIEVLNILGKEMIEIKQIKFIETVLNSLNPKEVLFNECLLLTEESVKRCYRELVLYFHPDKHFFLSDENKELNSRLFILIQQYKEELLQTANNEFAFHEEKGHQHWKLSQEYKEAAAGHWDKVESLKREDICHLSQEILDSLRREQVRLARESYKVCCKFVDSKKLFKDQIKFRSFIALCFLSEKQYLEAQLYALATINLILNNRTAKQEELNEAIKILNKIKGVQLPAQNKEHRTDSQNQTYSNETALMLPSESIIKCSYLERQTFQEDINKKLKEGVFELMLRTDRSLVQYQYPIEEILKAQKKAFAYKALGTTVIGEGVLGGAVATVWGTMEVTKAATLMAAGVATGPIFAIVGGVLAIGLGVYAGISLWKKGNSLYKEPEVRASLNKILANAVKYYDDKNFQEFLKELSKGYQKGSSQSLITLEIGGLTPKEIITCLLEHGFRPDGISYLLNLIGEVLLSGKVVVAEYSQMELSQIAKEFFFASFDKKLEASAKELDKRITEQRKNSAKSILLEIFDELRLQDYTYIAKQNLEDAEKMPFQTRLDEVRYISKLNIAVLRIIGGEIDPAVKLVNEVQNLVLKNSLYIPTTHTRLEALKDFLWSLTGQSESELKMLE